ncbi:MAG: ribonuclease D [Synechococcus sp.]|nr:ribonuclease D [Synechococcus sp.]
MAQDPTTGSAPATGRPPGAAGAGPTPTLPPQRFAVFDADLDQEWLDLYGRTGALAVDTEAMGLIHGRDRLCLVQLCDAEDNVCCIRLARDQRQAERLQRLLENPAIEKVFHFARFDVAALAENLGIAVNPLFCTKVASRLARTYAPRHGLKDVVQELVGVELDKQAQSSDWGRVEELSEGQLAYAAGDVRWLLAARDRLETMLRREQRWQLAQRCFACLPVFSDLDRMRFGTVFEH